MKKKLLVFGVNSFLGKNIINCLSESCDIRGTYFKSKPNFKLKKKIKFLKFDLKKKNFFKSIELKKYKPDIIINCAGESNVNVCNKNKKQCKNKIFIITKNTSDFAKKKGSYYVTISTDILFKNAMNKLCTEKHKPSPYNYYGKLKFSAEKYVTKTNKNSLIIRTRFFGLHSKKNFFSNILSIKKNKKKLICYDNVYSTPIYVNDLIKTIISSYNKKVKGIINISGNQSISRYEFATLIAKEFNINKKYLSKKSYNKNDSSDNIIYSSSLSNKKIQKLLGLNYKRLSTAIREIRYNYK
tara:strand:+ start:2362 stop:3255 length:894 start_codon:yes stop_codon:yes gene_type:complete